MKFKLVRIKRNEQKTNRTHEKMIQRRRQAISLLSRITRICKRSFSDIGNRLVPGPLLGNHNNKNFDLLYFELGDIGHLRIVAISHSSY